VSEVQELLGAPPIGGGSAQPGGGGRENQRSQISLPSRLKCTKMMSNGRFSALIYLKIAGNYVFYLKVLNKIYSTPKTFFEE
jgi:hypothetical protein